LSAPARKANRSGQRSTPLSAASIWSDQSAFEVKSHVFLPRNSIIAANRDAAKIEFKAAIRCGALRGFVASDLWGNSQLLLYLERLNARPVTPPNF
jgi:hypothetical protein